MTDRKTCKIWLAILLAVLFASAVTLLMHFFGTTYESNDDLYIAGFISRDRWCPFVSKLLTAPLQKIETKANVWTVFSILCIAAGAAMTAYVLCRNMKPLWLVSLVPLCISVYGIFAREMNFTRTSVCIFSGGASMLLFAVFGDKIKNAERAVSCVLGILSLIISALIRDSAALMGLGILAALTLALLIMTAVRADLKNEWKELLRKALLMFASAMLCLSLIKVNDLLKTPEEKEFERFNAGRSGVVDYSDNYPGYWEGDARKQYDDRGISEMDFDLMTNWNASDTEIITTEKYESMNEMIRPTAFSKRHFTERLLSLVRVGSYTLPVLLILLTLVIVDFKNSLLPTLLSGLMFLALYSYLYFSGREIDRVTQPAFYTMAALSIAGTVIMTREESAEKMPSRTVQVLAAASLVGAILCCPFAEKIVPDLKKQKQEKRMYEYLNRQDDKVFAMFEDSDVFYVYDPENFTDWEEYDNIITMGGWTCRLPEWYDKIHALDIENPYRALFERDDVYATYNRTAHKFLNVYYGEISASEFNLLPPELRREHEHFVRYIKYRKPGEVINADVKGVNEMEPVSKYGRRWEVTGRVDSEPGTVYVNVKCGDKKLTYAVDVDERGSFYGKFYDVPESFEFEKAEYVFFK